MRNKERNVYTDIFGTSKVSSLISVWEGKDEEQNDKDSEEEEEYAIATSKINKKNSKNKEKSNKKSRNNNSNNNNDKKLSRIPVREVTRNDSKIKILLNRIERSVGTMTSKKNTAITTSSKRRQLYNRNNYCAKSFYSIPDEIGTSDTSDQFNEDTDDNDDDNTELSYPTFVRPSLQSLPQSSTLSDLSLSSYASLTTPKRNVARNSSNNWKRRTSPATISTATMGDLSERSISTTSTITSTVSILRNSSSNRSKIFLETADLLSDASNRSAMNKVSWHPQLELDWEGEEDNSSFMYDNNDELIGYDEKMGFWEDDDDDGHHHNNTNDNNIIAANIAVDICDDDYYSSDDSDEIYDPVAYLRRYKANLK